METIISELAKILVSKGLTIATAESCTGGAIASALTQIPGASVFFRGSVVAYHNDIKTNLLGVREKEINEHTVVSEPVARQMVEGICHVLHADIGISTTGIAGPTGGSPSQPVGTVWLGFAIGKNTFAQRLQLHGNRNEIIKEATNKSLLTIFDFCKNNL